MAEKIVERLIADSYGTCSYYEFLYNNLERVVKRHESRGHTRVRFVSQALCHRRDQRFRHVSLECREFDRVKVFEKCWYTNLNNKQPHDDDDEEWRDEFTIRLPNISYTIEELVEFEASLPKAYIIGLSDCRHRVSDMLNLCYPLPLARLPDDDCCC